MLNKTGNIQARKYTEEIECYTVTSSVDAYGMETVSTPTSIGTFDAQVTQMSQYKKQLYYKDASVTGVEIRMRYTPTPPNKVVWCGHDIIIGSVENVDNRNRELVLTGSYQEPALDETSAVVPEDPTEPGEDIYG